MMCYGSYMSTNIADSDQVKLYLNSIYCKCFYNDFGYVAFHYYFIFLIIKI